MSGIDALARGFEEPVTGAQACFRAVLQAMSYPGRVVALPRTLAAEHPPLSPATAAILLALLDEQTSVRLHGALASDAAFAWLRFYTGTRAAAPGEGAPFVAAQAEQLDAALWRSIPIGRDDEPQDGGTLIVEVPWLSAEASTQWAQRLSLQGPGIADSRALAVGGIPADFWRHRIALQAQFPRGMELLLVHQHRLVAIPRTTRIELEA